MTTQPRLVPLGGDGDEAPIPLQSGKCLIGRKPPADIVAADASVSHRHAELEIDGGEVRVRDLDSKNGIFVNDARVSEAVLRDQDFLAVGSLFFRFEAGEELPEIIRLFHQEVTRVKDEIAREIIGQEAVIEQLLAAIFGGGHCLLVGVPGLAKTAIAKTLAKALHLKFKRVQFTPDLMPSDITGTNIINLDAEGDRSLKFVPGPLFTQFLLADEINRTPPKTQAALLEAMQEHQVTVGNETYRLPAPFFVVATQNPIEQEGTYPLPEAQLDRFMFSIHVDYPSQGEEEEILRRTTTKEPVSLRRVLETRAILRYQRAVQQVEVAPYVIAFVTKLVRATRPRNDDALEAARESLEWGAGPRAGQYLIWGAKVMAAMAGRLAVSCDDVRRCAVPVLRHRLAPNFQAQASGLTTVDIVTKLLQHIPEPDIAKYV